MTDATSSQEYVVRTVQHFCFAPDRHILMHHTVCEKAWPATGEQDRRMTSLGVSLGEMRSLALAMGGHRPFTGESTKDQMAKALTGALPGDYEVRYHEREDAYEIHRIS